MQKDGRNFCVGCTLDWPQLPMMSISPVYCSQYGYRSLLRRIIA